MTAVFAIGITTGDAEENPLACKTRQNLAGACFTVHGRLMVYNGTPSFRIWIIGTNRLLGVHEVPFGDNEERPLMPQAFQQMTGGDEYELFGDFEVCPLSKRKEGAMQIVCVESGKNIIKAPYGGFRYNDTLR